MAGFLYFIEGANDARAETLAAAGLLYALDPERIAQRPVVTVGPGGGPGMCVCAAGGEDRLGYFPDRQVWRKLPPGGGPHSALTAWAGHYRDELPGPGELLRAKGVPGHAVALGDGNDWMVPLVRGLAFKSDDPDPMLQYYIALPQRAGVDDAGRWVERGVVPRYEHLWRIAAAFWDQMQAAAGGAADTISFDFPGLMDAAASLLAANYRIGPVEIDWLGLLDDQRAREICQAAIDWPTLQLWLKKKLAPAG